jgi:hypothetical protein
MHRLMRARGRAHRAGLSLLLAGLVAGGGAGAAGASGPVRAFDGVDDDVYLRASPATDDTGAVTIATLIRPAAIEQSALVALHTSAGAGTGYAFSQTANGGLALWNGSSTSASPGSLVTSGGWQLAIVTKAAGSATPRFHVYDFGTTSWQHLNGSSAIGDGASIAGGGEIRLGSWVGRGFWEGEFAGAALWTSALSDAQVERLAGTWADWQALAPGGMWLLNQTSETHPVLDETRGGADERLSGGGWAAAVSSNPPLTGDPDTLILNGDLGTGSTNQWWSVQEEYGTAQVSIGTTSPAPPSGESRYGRFELSSGDQRAELLHLMQLREGENVFVRFFARLEPGFPLGVLGPDWGSIFWQLHQEGTANGSPPISFVVNPDGTVTLEDAGGGVYWDAPASTGTWHEFVVNVHHDDDPGHGYVELWVDGLKQELENRAERMYGQTLIDDYNYPKAGYYRDVDITGYGAVQIAGYRIARTYADAQP